MNSIKRLARLFVLSLTVLTSYPASDFEFDHEGDVYFDVMSDDDVDLDLINTEIAQNTFDLRTIKAYIAGKNYLSKIVSPFWGTTAAPAGRDALYLMPYKISSLEYGGFACNFFINSTNKMKVTTQDLFRFPTDKEFFDLMDSFLPAGGVSATDAMQLLPLLKRITIQEKKLGGLLQAGINIGAFNFQIHTSVQLGARNFWLNLRDQRQVRKLFADKYQAGGDLKESEFYVLRVGMGDTRLKLGMNTINSSVFQNDVGFEAIIPTSAFSSQNKVRIGIAEATFDDEKDTATAIKNLKAVRNYLLNPRIGNGGHYGFGCFFESKLTVFKNILEIWSRASYDVFLPNDEERLFMFKKTISPEVFSNPGGEFQDPGPLPPPAAAAQNAKNVKIANQFIRENIFPSSFRCTVYPGGVTNFVIAGRCQIKKNLSAALGYDFYSQKGERIKRLRNTDVDMNDLDIFKAQNAGLFQHKVFSEILYHVKKQKSDTGFGFGGDVTVASRRIGEDWTAYFKVTTSF